MLPAPFSNKYVDNVIDKLLLYLRRDDCLAIQGLMNKHLQTTWYFHSLEITDMCEL